MAIAEDLWGELPRAEEIQAPRRILREQAQVLSDRTKRILVGQVETKSFIDGFQDTLVIIVPLLNNYTVDILEVRYPLAMYPLSIVDLLEPSKESLEIQQMGLRGKPIKCQNEQDFRAALKQILQSEHVHKAIGSLLALVKD